MTDEAILVNLDKVDPDQLRLECWLHVEPDELRVEFRDGVAKLVNLIFSKAKPRQYGSQYVTGPVLAGLVECYVHAINEGAVPTIATAWQCYAHAIHKGAIPMIVTAFQGVAEAESRRAAEAGEAEAIFADLAVGDERIKKAHEAKMEQAVQSRYEVVRARKLAEAAAAVTEALYAAHVLVNAKLREGGSLKEVEALISDIVEEFAW
eukprot:gene10743-17817_t